MTAPCCILQGSELGNIYRQPLSEIWNGETCRRLRMELTGIMRFGADWEADPATDSIVVPMCGLEGGDDEICPIRCLYFRTDVPFMQGLNARQDLRRTGGTGTTTTAQPHL